MSKKYYIRIAGWYKEVSKEEHDKYKRWQRHQDYLREQRRKVKVHSLDALVHDDITAIEMVEDTSVNVEEEVIHKMMLYR